MMRVLTMNLHAVRARIWATAEAAGRPEPELIAKIICRNLKRKAASWPIFPTSAGTSSAISNPTKAALPPNAPIGYTPSTVKKSPAA